jgi:hypothetical protein
MSDPRQGRFNHGGLECAVAQEGRVPVQLPKARVSMSEAQQHQKRSQKAGASTQQRLSLAIRAWQVLPRSKAAMQSQLIRGGER